MKMEIKIDKKDCLLKELKVPKGYRIIEDYELLKESRTNKEIGEITKKVGYGVIHPEERGRLGSASTMMDSLSVATLTSMMLVVLVGCL